MAGWNEWVPGANMTLSEVLDALKSASIGLDVKDKLYWSFFKVVQEAIKEGNANFDVEMAKGYFKDLASRLDASDEDFRKFSVEVDEKLGNLLDGGPSIFMDSLAMLQSTYPNGASGVALVRETDPAKIYVWDGSIWKDFGEYQGNVIRNDSVTTDKIGGSAVSYDKTDFLEVGKNLIDASKVASGQINRLTGGTLVSSVFEYTDYYIDVSNISDLVFSPLPLGLAQISYAFYDTSLNFISGDNMEGKVSISVPPSAGKMRISWRSDGVITKDVVQLEVGITATAYEPFHVTPNKLLLSGTQVFDGTIQARKTSFISFLDNQPDRIYQTINLSLYRNTQNDGKIITADGSLAQTKYTTAYTVTDFIPVISGLKYNTKYRNAVLYRGDTPVEFIDNSGIGYMAFDVPENVEFVRFTVELSMVNELLLTRRSPLESEAIFEIPNLIASASSRFKGKTIASFGDSITGNYPTIVDTIKMRLGNATLNFGIGGAKMAERNDTAPTTGGGHTANSGIRIIESVISGDFSDQRTYTNAMYSGTTLDRILNTIDLLESTNFNTIDYATVQFGANDYLQGVPIGTIDGDRYTFMGAYRIFLETILDEYPNIKLLIVSTPIIYNTAPKGIAISEYVQATKEVAEHFNLPYLDNYTNAGINLANRLQFFNSTDGVHPKTEGLEHLGNRIASALEKDY